MRDQLEKLSPPKIRTGMAGLCLAPKLWELSLPQSSVCVPVRLSVWINVPAMPHWPQGTPEAVVTRAPYCFQ